MGLNISTLGMYKNKLAHAEVLRKQLQELDAELEEIKARLDEEEKNKPPPTKELSPVREEVGVSDEKLQAIMDSGKEKQESPTTGLTESPYKVRARGVNIGKAWQVYGGVLHSPMREDFKEHPKDSDLNMAVGPFNPKPRDLNSKQPYELLKKWSTQLEITDMGMRVCDPVDAGFMAPSPRDEGYFWKQFEDCISAFSEGRDFSFAFMDNCPSHAKLVGHPFFKEYIREQKENLPARCTTEVMGNDKNGKPVVQKIGCCYALPGAKPKPKRHTCEVARRLGSSFSKEVPKYALPPTSKDCALESLIFQMTLISAESSWKNLVNDKHSDFANTIRSFETQARRTPTGGPMYAHMDNPYRVFHDVMDDRISSFDMKKSTGFEARIREGPKRVWMDTTEGRSHLLYRTMCKLLLTIAASSELQSATPEEMIWKYYVRDPTEVFVKEEAHGPKKVRNGKWRLIWALSFSDNLLCKFLFDRVSKNLIRQFQRDSHEGAFSAIGIGHDDDGLTNALMRLMRLHYSDGSGKVTTDDASNWDVSTTRDGFMLAGMALFPAMVSGSPTPEVIQKLMFGFMCAHNTRGHRASPIRFDAVRDMVHRPYKLYYEVDGGYPRRFHACIVCRR